VNQSRELELRGRMSRHYNILIQVIAVRKKTLLVPLARELCFMESPKGSPQGWPKGEVFQQIL